MTDAPPFRSQDDRDRARDSDDLTEFDDQASARWQAYWAPTCPDGSPQRLAHALAHRERNVGELELRVVLGGSDHGVCQVITDERADAVYVRVLVCMEDDEVASRDLEYMNCPVRVWLQRPLGNRAVIDVDTDRELPLHVPKYRTGHRLEGPTPPD